MEKYDIKRHGVTQGLLQMFIRCRQETANWILGLEPLRTTQGLQFGTLAHIVLEKIYGKGLEPSREDVFKALTYAQDCYLKERGGRVSAEEQNFIEENLGMLEVVLPRYFNYYKKDFKKVKWAELEQMFRVPSPLEGVDIVGRIDGAFWLGKKELCLQENKTKSRIEEETLTDSLVFDPQVMTYIYALVKKYGVTPKHCLYNIIRRPGERQGKKENVHQFRKRVDERIRLEPEHYFVRYEISISKPDYNRFVESLRHKLKEFKMWLEEELPTYRNENACIQRFGPCKFLPLCANNERGLYRQRADLFPELVR